MRWESLFVAAGALMMISLWWVLRGRPAHERAIGYAMLVIVLLGFAFGWGVLLLAGG